MVAGSRLQTKKAAIKKTTKCSNTFRDLEKQPFYTTGENTLKSSSSLRSCFKALSSPSVTSYFLFFLFSRLKRLKIPLKTTVTPLKEHAPSCVHPSLSSLPPPAAAARRVARVLPSSSPPRRTLATIVVALITPTPTTTRTIRSSKGGISACRFRESNPPL